MLDEAENQLLSEYARSLSSKYRWHLEEATALRDLRPFRSNGSYGTHSGSGAL